MPQCHTHKYDPFKQAEYYKFFAYFNDNADSSRDGSIFLTLPTEQQDAALAEVGALKKPRARHPNSKRFATSWPRSRRRSRRKFPKR
ncbi:MAG: hypothetical protein QM811_29620 [Pirellulales bacterium]